MLSITLKPLGAFHLQTGGLDHERVDAYPRSDTLSAAIMHHWAAQYGSIPGLPDLPPFRISSVYPLLRAESDQAGIRLFPKPQHITFDLFKKWVGEDAFSHKEFKKIKWMDESLFMSALADPDSLEKNCPKNPDDGCLACSGSVWLHNNYSGIPVEFDLQNEQELTRVVLDRVTQSSTPYHFVNTHFPEDTGLHFLADVQKEHFGRFMTLLRLLGDEGIGADRTVGLGHFRVTGHEEWQPPNQGGAKGWLNLGLFNPAGSDMNMIDWPNSRYELISRGGWVSGLALRRRSVRMIAEGAVLKSETAPEGRLVNVLDSNQPDMLERHRDYLINTAGLDHPVYRDGRTIMLPLNRILS
ncbi:MAG: type III-A CRISPR-associated RAMP protein Csm4 [Cyclonatronaceae bacterium]